jgi:hypothetical protein
MFESMLSSGRSSGYFFPDSGPGPTKLTYGTPTLGWFGEVSAASFFTHDELGGALNLQSPVLENLNYNFGPWLKLVVDNKVIFTPKFPLSVNINWNDLYANGLVYGTDDNGRYPATTPVNQMKVVVKNNKMYKVRLFDGGEADPTAITTSNPSVTAKNSEFVRVFHALTGQGSNPEQPKWNIYTHSQMYQSPVSKYIVQNTIAANTTQTPHWHNDFIGVTLTAKSNASKSSFGWRPVLEIVPSDGIQKVYEMTYAVEAGTPALPNKAVLTTELVYPANPHDYHLQNGAIAIPRRGINATYQE